MERRATVIRVSVYALILLIVVSAAYLAVSGWSAFRSLSSAREALSTAQRTVGDDPEGARAELTTAQDAAASAAATLTNPMWKTVGAVPYFGATPKTAAVVAQSLDEALSSVEPALGTLDILKPSSLVAEGRIDIAALQEAVPMAEEALPGIRRSLDTLDEAPTTGLLLANTTEARDQLQEQLSSLEATLSTAVTFGKVAGPLLGQEGEKRYFLGLLNPNETRGTGGFLGTYGILTAKDGRLTIDSIGSNTDIPDLESLPPSIGDEFRNRYGDDPLLIANMNMSPHFPDTAAIWLAAWKAKTGEELDGAMAMDVVSLGQLVAASGQPVTLPDGSSMTGTELIDFALRDIYSRFPDSEQRKEYQEAVAQAALTTVTSLPKPLPMAAVFGQAFTDRRIVIWSRDPAVETELGAAGISGSIAVGAGHHVQVVLLNSSGSKLDAWLSSSVTYDVGRCLNENNAVNSSVSVDLRSDVPLGERPSPYMVGFARQGQNGPINSTFVQIYLPDGATLTSANLNGESVGRLTFTEQGRPAVLVAVDLPPRVTQRVSVSFTEPFDTGPGVITQQPLGSAQPARVRDFACS